MALTWDKALYDSLYAAPVWKHGIRFPVGAPPKLPLFNYHWFVQRDRLQRTITNFLSLPGAAQISHLAIVGGGFGWTAEILAANGVTAISVDTSPYVTGNEAVSEEQELRDALTAQGHDPDNLSFSLTFMSDTDPNATLTDAEIWAKWLRPDGVRTSIPVEQEDLANNGSRNKVRQRLSNNMDGILTEFALEDDTDATALTLCDRCQSLRPNPSVPIIHIVGDVPNPQPSVINYKSASAWRALLDANGFSNHVIATPDGRTF